MDETGPNVCFWCFVYFHERWIKCSNNFIFLSLLVFHTHTMFLFMCVCWESDDVFDLIDCVCILHVRVMRWYLLFTLLIFRCTISAWHGRCRRDVEGCCDLKVLNFDSIFLSCFAQFFYFFIPSTRKRKGKETAKPAERKKVGLVLCLCMCLWHCYARLRNGITCFVLMNQERKSCAYFVVIVLVSFFPCGYMGIDIMLDLNRNWNILWCSRSLLIMYLFLLPPFFHPFHQLYSYFFFAI